MLKAEDWQLPLDREFTLIKLKQEIDECNDKEALKEHLKTLIQQNAQFQHLLSKLLEKELHKEIKAFEEYLKQEGKEDAV